MKRREKHTLKEYLLHAQRIRYMTLLGLKHGEEWLKYMVQDIAKNHGYEFKYESVVDGFKKAIYQIYQSTNESEEKEDGKSK